MGRLTQKEIPEYLDQVVKVNDKLNSTSFSNRSSYRDLLGLWIIEDPELRSPLYRLYVKDARRTRETNKSEHGVGTDKDTGFRQGIRLPAGFIQFLTILDPETFKDKKKFHRLLRELPELRTRSKV